MLYLLIEVESGNGGDGGGSVLFEPVNVSC